MFKKGDKVKPVKENIMVIGENTEIKGGEILTVEIPRTECCGMVQFVGKQHHYPPTMFRLFGNSGDIHEQEKAPEGVLVISKPKLFKGLDDFTRSMFFYQQGGTVPTDMVRSQMVKFMVHLGISSEYLKEVTNGDNIG